MNMKKLLCMAMALVLALGATALAETAEADLQAQLDAANTRIAELEAQVALYQPYYEAQIVAEYGEDGIVWLKDAKAQYDSVVSMYSQYGISVDDYADEIKQNVLEGLVQGAVLRDKAEALGLSELSEETRAGLEKEAEETYQTYLSTYKGYFAQEGMSDEEVEAEALNYLNASGVTVESVTQNLIDSYISEQLYNNVTEDITVSEEEIKTTYDAMVAADTEEFADDYSYNSARSAGETITWNPEGYRAVKHVLIKFDDAQTEQYNTLQSQLQSLTAELEALDNPQPAEEAADAEAEDEETAEPEATEAPRSREEIQAEMGTVGSEIEALYSALLPRAQEVIDAFEGGADFESLIDQYGEDPGMNSDPVKDSGYAVAANSTYWDPAFTEGAMSIESVGQISAPVYGSYGIHIIYYLADITPGPVPFEDIAEAVEKTSLDNKISAAYNDQVTAWIEEAAPVYHLDRLS